LFRKATSYSNVRVFIPSGLPRTAKEALHDFKYFEYVEKNNPEYVRRLIRVLKNTQGLNTIEAWPFSCMYPTMML